MPFVCHLSVTLLESAASLSAVEFRLLGPVEVDDGSGTTVRLRRRQERLALAVLLLRPGQVVTTERLVELLWERPPASAVRSALPALISRNRVALASAGGAGEPPSLVARGRGYLLRVRPDAVDAHRFARLVAEARAVAEPVVRSELLAAALRLWRGPALADAATSAVRERLCGELEELRAAADLDRIDADIEAGRHTSMVAELFRLAREHPMRERPYGQLMIALYRSGRRADALQVYQQARQILVTQLGLEPGPQLRAIHASVLADTVGVAAAPDRPAPPVPRQLPAGSAAFVGQDTELAALHALSPVGAGPPAAAVVCVVSGTAGVG